MRAALVLAIALVLSGCSLIPTPAERLHQAIALATGQHWRARLIHTSTFRLMSWSPSARQDAEVLTVYLEGDGFAWLSGSQPSTDPTPRDPLGLRLALAQPLGAAAYLARPCQYIDAEKSACQSTYWTDRRLAPNVVAATNEALDDLKAANGAKRLVLVGYSGGGALAALAAAGRHDVDKLITVAGNLDTVSWVRLHGLAPLKGSLNPADVSGQLRLPQWHFAGARDTVVPPQLTLAFVATLPRPETVHWHVIPDFDHQCCWAKAWPALWQSLLDD